MARYDVCEQWSNERLTQPFASMEPSSAHLPDRVSSFSSE
jgi:hypothetical protein